MSKLVAFMCFRYEKMPVRRWGNTMIKYSPSLLRLGQIDLLCEEPPNLLYQRFGRGAGDVVAGDDLGPGDVGELGMHARDLRIAVAVGQRAADDQWAFATRGGFLRVAVSNRKVVFPALLLETTASAKEKNPHIE